MKLPRLRVSLRGALALLSILAILCAYGGYRLRKAMRQQQAVAYLQSQGGYVVYKGKFDGDAHFEAASLREHFRRKVTEVSVSPDELPCRDAEVANRLAELTEVEKLHLFGDLLKHRSQPPNTAHWMPLRKLRRLRVLSIRSGQMVECIHPDAPLEKVCIYGRLAPEEAERLARCNSLKHLVAKINDVEAMQAIGTMHGLTELHLSDSQAPAESYAALEPLTSLEVLSLDGTKITDEGLRHLAGMQRLKRLDLMDTGITDRGLEVLESLKALERISLGPFQLWEEGQMHWTRPQSLRDITLPENGINPEGLKKFQATRPNVVVDHWPQLEVIHK